MLNDRLQIDHLKTQLFDARGDASVYAVLDGAINPGLLRTIAEMKPEHCCLWLGELEPAMQEVAPYLVRLSDDAFTDYVIAGGFGDRWGIYCHSTGTLRDLRAHFRKFVITQLPSGKRVYFRFYDPSVMGTILDTSDAEQSRALFGPVDTFLCEPEADALAAGTAPRFRVYMIAPLAAPAPT